MGSAAEVPVVISSDEEDGAQTAAAGKRKSPEDAVLAWAEGILGQDDADDDVVGDGVGYPAMMLELLDSLKDVKEAEAVAKEAVVGDKEGVVGGKNTNTVPDPRGDDDDDCVILDGDPDKPLAVAEEGGPPRDAAEDELQIVAEKGEVACRDFPHPRHLCAAFPFSTSSHASHCTMCHCYVCDCPAPCALWDNHCHATDKDAKWKRLRQMSKNKSQPNPKRRIPQHLNRSIMTGPSSQYSANVAGFTGRFPASGTVNQIQQVDTSIMVAQNMGRGISLPSAPSPMPRTKIPTYGSKGAQGAPPLYTSSNGNHLQPSIPSYGLVQPARAHASQTAQVSPGGHVSAEIFRRYPPQFPVGAPMGSQGHQYRPPSFPQLAPNTVVGTGVPLSRCASLNAQAQGTQRPQVPSAGTTSKESLANLARWMGLSDYNTNQPLGQQSSSTSQFLHMHPREILLAQGAQNTTWQAHVKKSYVATTSQIVPSSGHNSSNHAPGGTVLSSGSVQIQQEPGGTVLSSGSVQIQQAPGGTVLSSGSVQIRQPLRQLKSSTVVSSGSAQIQQPLCQLKSQSSVTLSSGSAQIQQPFLQLKSQSSVTPSETTPNTNTLYLPQP